MVKVKAFAVCCTAVGVALPANVPASSHREAPGITATPKADGTDLYVFRSYEQGRADHVTLIANYQPFQDPFGGPNYYMMDPNALYEIHVDNDGDARADVTFQFRFNNTNKDTQLKIGDKQVAIPLIQSEPISAVNPASLNVRETFTARVTRRGGSGGAITNASGANATGTGTFDKPVDNIGTKTIADYAAYAAQHMYNVSIPGCNAPGRMFVGQRREGFAIAVGEVFDLVNIANPVGPASGEANDLEDKNVTSLALEVPISCLTRGGDPIIGAWSTARLSGSGNVLDTASNTGGGSNNRGGDDDDDRERRAGDDRDDDSSSGGNSGSGRQVSRLGMPLVNEVVIGLKDKDRFNASEPRGDAQFAQYVTNPTLPALVEKLFSAAGVRAPTKFPRTDLVAAFLTGIPELNQPKNVRPAEMIRLNTSIAAKAKGAQNALGVLGGDTAGFPNGRRPGDDVVDIELRVAMGVLCTLNQPEAFGCVPADAPSGGLPFTDGVATSDARFDATFPYLQTPMPGAPADYAPATPAP